VTAPIRLTIPDDPRYHGVARLVVGGLAARLDLSYEHLEDLQLALASVLENDGYTVGPEVNVELVVEEGSLELWIGPLNGDALRADLERESETEIGLGRLLRTVVEEVELQERTDGQWLRLEKRLKSVKTETAR
jgi:anti-sigma regulatory factor (Ser/Thr protein kinase)